MHRSRHFIVLNLIFCLGPLVLAAQKQPDTNSLETKSGTELLTLIRLNVKAVRVEAPSSKREREVLMAQEDTKKQMNGLVKECNGQDSGVWTHSDSSFSEHCQELAAGLMRAGSTESELKALILGCWWDTSEAFNSSNCVSLAAELINKGNAEAARTILSSADGCHSHNTAGDPINLCVAFAISHPEIFRTGELKSVALDAYSREQNPDAARYLASIGVDADVAAADANHRQAQDNAQQAREQQQEVNDAATAQKQQQQEARLDSLTQLANQVSQNGGLIQQTATQQEANIRAAGDANAAQQQQQVQARIAAQQTAAGQQAAAQQTAPQAAPQNDQVGGGSSGGAA
jgi:hypothetical protein